MNTNMNPNEQGPLRIRRDITSRRLLQSWPIIAIGVTLLVLLLVVFGVRAIELLRGTATGDVLNVPSDYATIQAAVDAANPGDIIQVRSGLYVENITLHKPVTLIAESFDEVNPVNNTTVIDGGGAATTITIPPGLAQMPIIRGFVLQNSTTAIQAASGFVVEFSYFHSATTLVAYQQGGGGFNRNNIYYGALDNAIRLDNMDSPVVIENNRIMYSDSSGIEISLQVETAPPSLVEIDIWNNMILGNAEDGIQIIDHEGIPFDTNRRFVIAGNLIANNKKAGLGLMPFANTVEDYSGADMAEAVRVYNNTFYGNDYGISGGDNLVAFNNIIVRSIARGAWRVNSAPSANVPVATGYAPGNNSVVAYTLFNNNAVDADETVIGQGVIFDVDPRFEAEPNPGPDGAWETVDDDFSGLVLRSDSPAIDKGVTQYQANNGELIPEIPITGFTGAAPDLGWREFGAPIFPTPTVTPTLIASATVPPTMTPPSITPLSSPTSTSVTPTTVPPTATPVSPVPSPTTAPGTATLTSTPASTSTPEALSMISIEPISAQANAAVTMTITGTGFKTGAIVTFEGGQGTLQEILAIQVVDAHTIVVTMTARNSTTSMQLWDVRVTNPDTTSFVLPDAFTVIPAP